MIYFIMLLFFNLNDAFKTNINIVHSISSSSNVLKLLFYCKIVIDQNILCKKRRIILYMTKNLNIITVINSKAFYLQDLHGHNVGDHWESNSL